MRRRPFVHPLRRVAERHRPRSLIELLFEETRRFHHAQEPPDLRQASTYQLIGYYCFGDGAARNEASGRPAAWSGGQSPSPAGCGEPPDLTRRSENAPIASQREQEVDA
jgi:hypothetical protein